LSELLVLARVVEYEFVNGRVAGRMSLFPSLRERIELRLLDGTCKLGSVDVALPSISTPEWERISGKALKFLDHKVATLQRRVNSASLLHDLGSRRRDAESGTLRFVRARRTDKGQPVLCRRPKWPFERL
jgi:hypothetical protein